MGDLLLLATTEGGNAHCVLVVVETDLFAKILGIGTVVDDTLRIVYVAVLADTSGRCWVGGIGYVEHEESAFAAGAARRSDGIDHVLLLVRNDVVRGSETTVPSGQIVTDVERPGGPFDGQELWQPVS